MRLSDLKTGQSATIVKILGHGAFRKRVMEMGFIKGHSITAVLAAPMRDPVKYRILGYEVSLRRSEAQLIEVIPDEDAAAEGEATQAAAAMPDKGAVCVRPSGETECAACPSGDTCPLADENMPANSPHYRAIHTINVALIGNPNCGKTSLFNIASGAREHVGNYSGVTVDSKTGVFRHKGYTFNLVDLPGTYSLSSYSPEERYVRRYLKDNNPDVILNVVDSSNLERNLYLTTELIDMDHAMVIALNMYDELRSSGAVLDYEELGRMIGVPMVPTVSRTGEGIDRLFDTIIDVYERRHQAVRHVHVKLGQDIEASLADIKQAIKTDKSIDQHFSSRYLAIKLLEQDKEAEDTALSFNFDAIMRHC